MDLKIIRADLSCPSQATAMVELLDAYARDPMGGGRGLSEAVKSSLAAELHARSFAHCLLAYLNDKPVGLLNGFEGFSTFAAKPLFNIHDIAVLAEYRSQGIASQLLREAERLALELGCCKLTLEVLAGNEPARRVYRRSGFVGYALDPKMGEALCMEKKLS